MIPQTGGWLDYVAEIAPVVGTLLLSYISLYLKVQLDKIRITQLEQEARLIKHQNKVKEELVCHQQEIRETIIKHVAEDAIQFRYIKETNQEIKSDIKQLLRK
jgi:hypothetical protein